MGVNSLPSGNKIVDSKHRYQFFSFSFFEMFILFKYLAVMCFINCKEQAHVLKGSEVISIRPANDVTEQ